MSDAHLPLTNKIDALLPQTQCGLCTYQGCKPYAEAIANDHEAIDLCLPGGVDTLRKLGDLLQQDVSVLEPGMAEKAKPSMVASVRENECIGCTKCIQACPVDAIIGAPKLMHAVITDACNGCELCVPPCPVDCIDMFILPERSEHEKTLLQQQSRERFEKHTIRTERIEKQRREKHLQAKQQAGAQKQTITARKTAIEEILARKQKR